MTGRLPTSNPYESLCRDLYSIGIFDQTINGCLSVIERDDESHTILIDRKFPTNSEDIVRCGYCFVQCLDCPCNQEHLRRFRQRLERLVNLRAGGNYMEVDPILIAREFDTPVISFVEDYNAIQRRKPIQLFTYGA